MKNRRLFLPIALFVISCFPMFGQQVITGKVVDTKGAPIPFSTVQMTNTSTGTYANIDGEFRIAFTDRNLSLTISHIGYHAQVVTVDLTIGQLVVELKEDVVSLKAIIIETERIMSNPKQIVKKAISMVEETSNDKSHMYEAYFHQIDIEDGEYKRVIDADLLVGNSGHSDQITSFDVRNQRTMVDSNWTKLSSVAGKEDNYNSRELPCWYKNNFRRTASDQNFNRLNNSTCSSFEFGVLDESFVKDHRFKLDTMSSYFGEDVYVIKILPSSSRDSYHSFPKNLVVPVGKIFIRVNDLAILKVEYNFILNPKKRNTFDFQLIQKVLGSGVLEKVEAVYQEYEEKIYLSYLKTDRYLALSDEEENRRNDNQRVYNLLRRELFVKNIITSTSELSQLEEQRQWNSNIHMVTETAPEFWNTFIPILETDREKEQRVLLERKSNQ